MHSVLAALGALVPPVGVGLIFWFALRSIIRADRSERAAIARLDAAEAGLPEGKGAVQVHAQQPSSAEHPAAPADK